jgi:hypothetical protein
VGSILGEFAKRLGARWFCPDTLGDPRAFPSKLQVTSCNARLLSSCCYSCSEFWAFPSGVTGIKACRYHNWMGEGARPGWLAHTEAPLPQDLHRVLMLLGIGGQQT